MPDYAIVSIQGKQYQVKSGDKIIVDRLSDISEGQPIDISQVLLMRTGDKILVGSPYLPDTKIKLRVVSHIKGDKIEVRKYKAKSRYRLHLGFRPFQSVLEVVSLNDIHAIREKKLPKTSTKPHKPASISK